MGPRKGSLSTAEGRAKGSQGTGSRWNPQAHDFRDQFITCDGREINNVQFRHI